MKKTNLFILIMLLSFPLFMLQSCDDPDDPENDLAHQLGWYGDEDSENIEDDINLGTQFGDGNLPSSVDLLEYFPAIGNQGAYGTCVAWACGYNLRGFLDRKAGGNTNYSAKDLFWAIDNSSKGEDCNGTSFQVALDIMVSRGIATESVVPYDGLGDCSSSPESGWTTNANLNKIENYREIDVNKDEIKGYLANGRAVVFGAKLGDEFMNASSDEVLSYQNSDYEGPHGYHAMILSGYDDSKGPNGSFRVVNSWDTNWGDGGYLWVDQDYFVKTDFCFSAFVGTGEAGDPEEVDDSEYDLTAWMTSDIQDTDFSSPLARKLKGYDIYNTGSALTADKDWNFVYLYYNAYDAEDYNILIFDYYSDDYGDYGENGKLTDSELQYGTSNWWNNIDLASGESASEALFGEDSGFNFAYDMPETLNGSYYFVCIADGFDVIDESNEENNYFWYTKENGDPFEVVNGVVKNTSTKKMAINKKPNQNDPSPSATAISERHVNAYSPAEINQMIIAHKESGDLQRKVMQFVNTKGNKSKTKAK